jgi:transposase
LSFVCEWPAFGITALVATIAPQLLSEPGFGPLTAAKLVGEIAGARRFSSDAKLARSAGLAPIPVSSGKTNRHRLDRGGNRQINAAIHRVAVTRARCHPETQIYLARKTAEGKTHREAIRCLKRHLAHRVWHLLQPPTPQPTTTTPHQLLDIGAAKAGLLRPLRGGSSTGPLSWASDTLIRPRPC